MAFVEWVLKGVEYGHCNCNTGCPCQFNSLPSHGHCRAHSFFQIERGHFGETALDGLQDDLVGLACGVGLGFELIDPGAQLVDVGLGCIA